MKKIITSLLAMGLLFLAAPFLLGDSGAVLAKSKAAKARKRVKNLRVVKITDSSATLKWKKIKSAEGYYIKLYDWDDQEEELNLKRKIKVFEDGLKAWKLKRLDSGTEYYVKIKALFDENNRKYRWTEKELFTTLGSGSDDRDDDEDVDEDDDDYYDEDEDTSDDGDSSDEDTEEVYNTSGFYNDADNCLLAQSASDNPRCWVTEDIVFYGNSSRSGDEFILASDEDTEDYVIQDIVSADNSGKYLLLIGKTYTDNLPSDDLTGLPYLYGYQMTSAAYIRDYMQGDTMRYDGEGGNWDVSYGIFPAKVSTREIRFFLNQGLKAGGSYDDSEVKFTDLGVFVFDTIAEAEAMVSTYESSL